MNKKKDKKGVEQKLIDLLQHRIRSLEIEKQHYEQNPTIMKNVKIMNIEIIKNDIETLKKILNELIEGTVPEFELFSGSYLELG